MPARLDINIFERPVGHFFDPARVRLPVVDSDGAMDQESISHPWGGQEQLQVSVGGLNCTISKANC
jgi:hypothetical protein